MKVGSTLLNAVSAIALSAGLIAAGAGAATIAATTVAEAATVSRIEVRGNSRVDASTVRNNVTIKPGESFNNSDVDDSVKRLFATGLFSDVRISVSGSTLVVTVDENKVVNQVVFNGNRKLKDAQLDKVVQMKPLGPYNALLLEADAQSIRDAYAAIGRSDATVTTRLVPLDGGRVNVAFEINEGDRTKIASINFVGNQAYGDGRLADIISTKRSNFLSFLSRKDVYDEDKLRADEELLRRFYYNHGYADFRVVSSFAELDETQNEYVLTITVEEGERYTFGDVSVDSTVQGLDTKVLSRLLETRTGSVYSAENVEDSILAIADKVASQGYPFAQVTPRGSRNFTERTISVTYLVDEGTRAYVERIEIRGNTRTRDYVIRREFDIAEGDAFNQVLVRRAKKRLEELGFFDAVNIRTRPGSEPDRVVLVVDVKDKPTGEFGIGGGYSNTDGFAATLDITERNFLGRGQFIRASIGRGEDSQTYGLSFTEPYFLGYRLAAGFDLFKNEDSGYDGFVTTDQGINLRLSAPITENLTGTLAYKYMSTDYSHDTGVTVPSNPEAFEVLSGGRDVSSLTYTLAYNTLDSTKLPREGFSVRFSQEYAGLGGDAEFLRTVGKASYFHMLLESEDVIGQVSVGGGHVFATGDDNLNVFDHFNVGQSIIRGFDTRGIGPRLFNPATGTAPASYGEAAGGTTYFNGTLEVSAPMPLISRDLGLRFNLFADAATLYGNDIAAASLNCTAISPAGCSTQIVHGSDLEWRASVGVGITWASPFGPLRVYYAEPVVKEGYDKIKKFGFGASTRF